MEQNVIETQLTKAFAAGRTYVIVAVLALLIGGVGYFVFNQKQQEKRESALATLYRLLQEKTAMPVDASEAQGEALRRSFIEAAKSFSDVRGAALLDFEAGLLAEQAKNWSESRLRYESLLQRFPTDSPYRGLVFLRLAYVAEQSGDLATAKSDLMRAEALRANPQREFVLYHLGRIEEKLGETESAARRFESITQEFKDAPLAARARERLSLQAKSPLGSPAH